MFQAEELLSIRINELKKELIQIAKGTGLNSPSTLSCSQELDKLIVLKMRCLREEMKYEMSRT
ncbi:aspartyl-phosphate phosphatase Spo0E family protein [Niallia oryzisoli]|uniref:Aspartyl-phosphate phosphatase Spo0E family protein n=1 Tax=Niallia oryzisoli TaxID=1737571 RepID=A0ABZ2CA34_9BACI